MADRLYSPWRYPYLEAEKPEGCIFCINPDDDQKRLVVHRSTHCFVIMNLYPYNNGHIMIVPNRHLASLGALTKEEAADLFAILGISEAIIKEKYSADGLNIGINLGKAAGAGVDEHLHVHVVPRWFGDSNYMTVTANTRVIPEDFQQAYENLRKMFKKKA